MLKPCADCPFRADVQFVLSGDRARQIAKDVIQGDEAFHCLDTPQPEGVRIPDSARQLTK